MKPGSRRPGSAGRIAPWSPSSSSSSRAPPSSTSRGTSSSRPPASRSGPRRSGCRPRRSSSSRPRSSAGSSSAGRPSRRRRSRSASRRAPSRRRTSSSSPPRTAAATCRSSTRSRAGRRRSSRSPSASSSSGSGSGRRGSSGVAFLLVGLLMLQRPWRFFRRSAGGDGFDPAVGFALLTGVTIAAYSAVDSVGTRLVEPWFYAGLLWAVVRVLPLGLGARHGGRAPLARGRRRGRDQRRAGRPVQQSARRRRRADHASAAYLLILAAFSVAPLTAVAPLRESAIVHRVGVGDAAPGRGRRPGRGRPADHRVGVRGRRRDPPGARRLRRRAELGCSEIPTRRESSTIPSRRSHRHSPALRL